MEFIRTPDAAFADLPGFDHAPRYLEDLAGFGGLRTHYVDEGSKDAAHTYLCLHGEPTWSFLYRKMIPAFVHSGGRVIAPDLLGFGRSDKPLDEALYTYEFHRNHLKAIIDTLDLHNITLVCQDWGGLLGLTLPMDYPGRFDRMIVMNTTLAVGEVPSEGFNSWRSFVAANPDLDVAALMKRATPILTDAEAAAYSAPFPNRASKAGVRRFPQLVMTELGMNGVDISRRAANFLRTRWHGQCFMAVGAADPVLGLPVMRKLHASIRNASQLLIIEEGGHFLQEWGEQVAHAALDYFAP